MKIAAAVLVAASAIGLVPSHSRAGEPIACRSVFRMTSQAPGEQPGTLSTPVNTPCLWSTRLGGAVKGAPLGRAAGVTIMEQPRDGRAVPDGKSAFLFTPKQGFTGSDTMLMRFAWRNGASALVRFAISVD